MMIHYCARGAGAVFVAGLRLVCLLLSILSVQADHDGSGRDGVGGGSCLSSNDDAAHHDAAAYQEGSSAGSAAGSRCARSETEETRISYVLLAVSGTLEEGFELRKNMDYRPHGDNGPGRVNATFLGKALVRGYKSFLDIKNPTWREYIDNDDDDDDDDDTADDDTADDDADADNDGTRTRNRRILKTVNPAVVPTGCHEHANRYAIYAVDARQAILALAGEPRFLAIAADMGLVDLTAADDLTWPDIKALATAYAKDVALSGISSSESSPVSVDRIAFLTVTSTWLKSTMIPNGIIRQNEQEGIITDYPESVGLWSASILHQHDLYPQGCGSNPAGQGQAWNVHTAHDYNACIDAAIRQQEAEYTTTIINNNDDDDDDHAVVVGSLADFEFCGATTHGMRRCFDCKKPARYGTDRRTARFNKVLSACQLEKLMIQAGIVNVDDRTGAVVGPKFPLQGGGCYSSSSFRESSSLQ
jgi:hypothetical protein